MKKLSVIVFTFLAILAFVSCQEKSKTSISIFGGKSKVDLVGTWTAQKNNQIFKMIFSQDGSFIYGSGWSDGVEQLTTGENGDVIAEKEFNIWKCKGKFTTSRNIFTATFTEVKDFTARSLMVEGEETDFLVNIKNENELIIQTVQTGALRIYKRQ